MFVQDIPHDCVFIAAPIGEKYCHYDREVQITRWATSQAGTPIVSYDDGKTWNQFEPGANVTVPKYSTVEEVYITFNKVNE